MRCMKKQIKNAIIINYNNILFSPSIKLLVILVTFLSIGFSFWPYISKHVFDMTVSSNIQLSGNLAIVVGICCICMLFLVLLVTRIGAQVGFAKGSKVTEIILTTLTREELYKTHVISSILVAITTLSIVYLPMFIAGIINNNNYVLLFRCIRGNDVIFIILHMILTVCSMVILSISLASLVKRSEDTGPYLMICLLPFIISLIYESIMNKMYGGIFTILNYIPLTSLIPSIGAGINNLLDFREWIKMISSDFIFILICYFGGRKIFSKNITK